MDRQVWRGEETALEEWIQHWPKSRSGTLFPSPPLPSPPPPYLLLNPAGLIRPQTGTKHCDAPNSPLRAGVLGSQTRGGTASGNADLESGERRGEGQAGFRKCIARR